MRAASTATSTARSTAQLAVVGDFDAAALDASRWRSCSAAGRAPKPFTRVAEPTTSTCAAQGAVIETPDKAQRLLRRRASTSTLRDDDPDYPALVLGNYMLGGGVPQLAAHGAHPRQGRPELRRRLAAPGDALDKSGSFLSVLRSTRRRTSPSSRRRSRRRSRARSRGLHRPGIDEAKSGWLQSRSVGRAQDNELVRALARNVPRPHLRVGRASSKRRCRRSMRAHDSRGAREVPGPGEVHDREGRRFREGRRRGHAPRRKEKIGDIPHFVVTIVEACSVSQAAADCYNEMRDVPHKKKRRHFAGAAQFYYRGDSSGLRLRSGDRRHHHRSCHAGRRVRAPALH